MSISLIDFTYWVELLIGITVFLAVYVLAATLTRAVNRHDIDNLRAITKGLGPLTKIVYFILGIISKLLPSEPDKEEQKITDLESSR